MSLSSLEEKDQPAVVLSARASNWRALGQQLAVLFKSRVVALLLLAAVGGAFLGAGGWPGLGPLLLVLLAGGSAASGAAALNEYLERGTDAIMRRTRRRPLVRGEFHPRWVAWASIGLIVVPSLAVLPFNPALAFFLLAGAFIYVGIYTLWLKPRTLVNIVIGGAAGSAAVLSGGAAAGAWDAPGVIALALLVFLWTPSHFWSLAILYRDDYARAGVPMLPTKTTLRQAAGWVFLHTGAAALVALVLAAVPTLGWLYFIPVALITADMVARNVRLIARPTTQHARALFIASNLYLMVVLTAICVASVVNQLL